MYNTKSFLLPESANSCAAFHAKTVLEDTYYKLTISDCKHSIMLHGQLTTYDECVEACKKLHTLQEGIASLRNYIIDNCVLRKTPIEVELNDMP